jgi:hypothetical protein
LYSNSRLHEAEDMNEKERFYFPADFYDVYNPSAELMPSVRLARISDPPATPTNKSLYESLELVSFFNPHASRE